MLDFRRLALLPNEQLGRYDIVRTHLACAAGLPGSEKIDEARCVAAVDGLVPWVRRYTDHCLKAGERAEPGDTEARSRMRALVTVLWRGAGIHYNLAKVADDAPWGLADSFLHGALFGEGGTCATLPILYAAVGRRLGYPLKLAASWGATYSHLFCRWDDPGGERFNIDANATGVSFPPDGHYRPPGYTPQAEAEGLFLRSMTPRQELSGFLAQRAHLWRGVGRPAACVDSWAWAAAAAPESAAALNTLAGCYNEWLGAVNARKPPGFPRVWLKILRRRYPDALPLRHEQNILCLQTTDALLHDPEAEERWWSALRRGCRAAGSPTDVYLNAEGNQVGVSFRSGGD